MNFIKDIKVTFIKKGECCNTEKIRLFFKDIFNNDVQIDLRPGETVFSQTDYLTNSLKIYSRKEIINISEEDKPVYLKYYIGYKEEEIDNKNFLFGLQNSLNEDNEKKTKKAPIQNMVENIIGSKHETAVEKAISEVKKYSEKKKASNKKGPGRPKKRGPKKGSKNKKIKE